MPEGAGRLFGFAPIARGDRGHFAQLALLHPRYDFFYSDFGGSQHSPSNLVCHRRNIITESLRKKNGAVYSAFPKTWWAWWVLHRVNMGNATGYYYRVKQPDYTERRVGYSWSCRYTLQPGTSN